MQRQCRFCHGFAPRPEPDIKGRPTFIDARSAAGHSIRKEWMARLILTRISEDRPVSGGMAHMCGRNTEGEQLQRYRRSPLSGPDGHDPVASRKFLQEIFTAQRSCVVCNAPFSDTFCFLFWCPHLHGCLGDRNDGRYLQNCAPQLRKATTKSDGIRSENASEIRRVAPRIHPARRRGP